MENSPPRPCIQPPANLSAVAAAPPNVPSLLTGASCCLPAPTPTLLRAIFKYTLDPVPPLPKTFPAVLSTVYTFHCKGAFCFWKVKFSPISWPLPKQLASPKMSLPSVCPGLVQKPCLRAFPDHLPPSPTTLHSLPPRPGLGSFTSARIVILQGTGSQGSWGTSRSRWPIRPAGNHPGSKP